MKLVLAVTLNNMQTSFPVENEEEANYYIESWQENFEVRIVFKSRAGIPKVWLIELTKK